MTITDLDGKEITVTDLQLAILQADDYRHYRVGEPSEYQVYLYNYWEDVYQKLLLLDTEIQSRK
ncbi:hypothetical protein [Mucilaginibacter sp.]|uniref:hypothetical protein n=1 Tax=Mucilaginibacter sp. TaxID=1882438 RepID=UPI0035BC3944